MRRAEDRPARAVQPIVESRDKVHPYLILPLSACRDTHYLHDGPSETVANRQELRARRISGGSFSALSYLDQVRGPSDPGSDLAMSFFKRHPTLEDDGVDADNVDPNLRLRTTLTAHSTLAESIRSELRQQRRKKSLAKSRSKFTFKRPGTAGSQKAQREEVDEHGLERTHSEQPQQPQQQPGANQPPGERRTIYVNQPLPQSETKSNGDPLIRYERNKVRTSSESNLCPLVQCSFRRIHRFDVYTQEPVRAIQTHRELVFPRPCRSARYALYSWLIRSLDFVQCFPYSVRPPPRLRWCRSS